MKRLLALATFVAALGFLPALCARAAVVDDLKINNTNGVFVTDAIYAGQPFSFAAPQIGSVQGEVISVETADGVVVQRAAADKYGRVFLAAGLPAGAYLISRPNYSQPFGKIDIKQRSADALDHTPHPLQLQNPPQTLKLSDPFSLSGHGFSPNFSDMRVSLGASGKTEAPLILAATEDQLKLAPVQQLQPGAALLRVTNKATEQSTNAYDLLLYHIQGELRRHKLHSGNDQTQLVVTTSPGNVPFKVRASVISGPVDFGAGRKEAEAVTRDGKAIFPVHAERGAGQFELGWELVVPSETAANADRPVRADGHKDQVSETGSTDFPQPPLQPVAFPRQDHGACHCTVVGEAEGDGGGTANLNVAAAERPAPKNIDLSPVGGEDADWARRRRDRPMFDNYLGTIKITFDILKATVVAHGDNNDQLNVERSTSLAIQGDNLQFQIFRKGNKGYLPIGSRGEHVNLHCPEDRQTFKGISGEEYLVEIWVSRQARDPGRTLTVQVDVSDTITPCGFAHHQQGSYQLTLNDYGVSKIKERR